MTLAITDIELPVAGGCMFLRRWSASGNDLDPIILLHESLGSVELWRGFPAALARATGRPVLAYDRLGFGRSSPREALPDADFIREEAEIHFPVIAQALGISSCVLFGHSVGGGMVLTMAALHPERCKAVITESAQAFVEPLTLAGIREAKLAFGNPEQFSRLTRYHGSKTQWVLDAWTETWLSPAFRDWSLDAWLPRVRCPVLAIHGDSDEYGSSAFPRRITEGVRGEARMEILAACGHVPHKEKEDEVLGLVVSFLSGLQ